MSLFRNLQLDAASWSPYRAAYQESDAIEHASRMPYVGQRICYEDGRVFRFAKAGGTITAGALVVAVPNEANIAATYFGAAAGTAPIGGEGGAIGDYKVRLTDDVSGVTADEYAGGYLNITDATGEGFQYRIKGNEATGSAGTGFLVTLYDPIQVALDNTSVGTMVANRLDGVVVHTPANYGGTATQACVGKAAVAATSGEYFWVQTWGEALIKAGAGTFIKGAPIQLAEDDAGSGQVPVATENRIQVIGVALEAAADTVWGPVFLQICP